MENSNDTPNNNGNGTPAPDELESLKLQIEEHKKQYLYLRADFDNFRKQTIKERSDLMKYGSEPVLREFIAVLDNLERARQTPLTTESIETFKEGLSLISGEFRKVLEKFGVEEVDPKGQIFDPMIHEALTSESNPAVPPNVVTQVFKKAYKLHGRVIRPAQVVVNTISQDGGKNGN
ncbi:MAG: nucleotide exchange factor GrpE [Oligoflexia bacterium]|nr:nucleotide exchange factor GrpE [Oligoflexia bacterium]